MIHHVGMVDCRHKISPSKPDGLAAEAVDLYMSIRDGTLQQSSPGVQAFRLANINVRYQDCIVLTQIILRQRHTRPSSIVYFIGAIDSVAYVLSESATTDQTLRCRHFRHALSTHEERRGFDTEIPHAYSLDTLDTLESPSDIQDLSNIPETGSLLQAWFLGTHTDLGGRHPKDGIALYPLPVVTIGSTEARAPTRL